jgi:putative drug exporter of the RND superfamily
LIARLADAVTGRRGRWVTIAAWLLIATAGFLARSQIDDVTAAGQSSFLPRNAESTRALDVLEHSQKSGEEVPVVIVFERDGGLTRADLDAIGRVGDGLNRLSVAGATPIVDPFSADATAPLGEVAKIADGIGPVSRDGEAALVVLAIDAGDRGAIVDGVETIHRYLAAHARPGLDAYVTGPGGIAADLEQVADEAGRTLLIATLSLVLILLLVVYRAPPLALLPLLTVGAAYLVATGIAYLLIEAGAITVNTEGTFLLLVLIFGAGTDYSLLLVHRYREELRSGRAPALALPKALRESAPAIAASGGTVIAATLVLLVGDLQSTHWLGPILAIGIAMTLAAAFTLLPALLSVLDERAFWPATRAAGQMRGSVPAHFVEKEPRDRWGRVAGLVRRRSRAIVPLVFALLIVLALGNLSHHGTIGFGQGETRPTDSSRGTAVLDEHFPPGIGSPLSAVVRTVDVLPVVAAMRKLDPVKLALPVPPTADTDWTVVVVVLRGDPYSGEAADAVKDIRERLHEIAPSGLLGGIPAENYDIEQTNARDTQLIVPLVLLVVGLILAAVLRALVAPAFLIATVVASFAATLGLCTFLFSELGTEGVAFDLVLLSFLFLVALGVDYNIFLMTRAREEAALRGTREGTLVALVNTGGVVTGAGLILAGTFATLTLLPLEELVQIGATVAIGVLLDTFVVRALLIPAIAYRLGERTWWPSRAIADPEGGTEPQ